MTTPNPDKARRLRIVGIIFLVLAAASAAAKLGSTSLPKSVFAGTGVFFILGIALIVASRKRG